jgi:hypothetical protein
MSPRLRNILLAATASLGLSACAYDGYGSVGYGYGYGGYDPYYYDDYYPGSYYGWWGDYYYPGTGFYVFDRRGHRHRWNDDQRHYWEGRRHYRRDSDNRPNWGGTNGGSQQQQQGNWSRGQRQQQQARPMPAPQAQPAPAPSPPRSWDDLRRRNRGN